LSRESWILPPATCRLDWRPSRLYAAALVLLGLLAGGCVLASGAPLAARLAIAAGAIAHALRLARRASALEPLRLQLSADAASLRIVGRYPARRLHRLRIRVHGPLALLEGRDARGQRHFLAWWPDTLPPRVRRSLRLAQGAAAHADAGPAGGPGFATMPG
jgi:toxin CptA